MGTAWQRNPRLAPSLQEQTGERRAGYRRQQRKWCCTGELCWWDLPVRSGWGPQQGAGLAMGHWRQQDGGGRGREMVVVLRSGTVKQGTVSGCRRLWWEMAGAARGSERKSGSCRERLEERDRAHVSCDTEDKVL